MTRKALDIGYSLPLETVTQRAAVIGRTGSGKSHTLRVLMEELIDAGLPVVALDPMGGLWGLRSSASGKSAGLPVTILGGEHGDIPLEPMAGAVVADLVVENPSAYIIDLSSFDTDAEEDRFAEAFAYRLFRAKARNKAPMCLVVDESDRFAPQRPYKGQERMLGAFNTLSRRARQRGLGLVLATQRPASLNKHALTQSELLVVHQVTGPQDRDAVDEWVKAHGSKEQREEFLSTVAKLDRGEAWVWSPSWLRVFERIRIRKARTFDSSKTPEPGDVPIEPKKLADVELAALRKRMAATIEKAKAEDPKELQKKIRQLHDELRKASAAKAETIVEVERRVEIPVVPKGLAESLVEALKAIERIGNDLSIVGDGISGLHRTVKRIESEGGDRRDRVPHSGATSTRVTRPARHPVARMEASAKQVYTGEGSLGKAERAFLAVLAQHGPQERTALATLAGYSSKSGHVDNTLGSLRTKGFVASGWPARATDAGLEALGSYDPLPTGVELRHYWLGHSQITKAGATFLYVLIEAYPEPLHRDELATRAGYSVDSGHVDNTLGRLRTMGLAHGPRDAIAASDTLFHSREGAEG